ncbi:MAG: cytochrome P450 [Candidatus Kapabacteria bacterium]|nr:cytochrome P450 [Candidatus Kapabacteria bacterium]
MPDNTTLKIPPRAPNPHWLLGHSVAFLKFPLEFFRESLRYGDIYGYRVGHLPSLGGNIPEFYRRVLQENAKNYVKGEYYNPLKLLLGQGLVTSEGDFWLKQRRIQQPAFHRQRMESFADMIVQEGAKMLDAWERRDTAIALDDELFHLTLTVVGHALFSVDFSGDSQQLGDALTFAVEFVNKRIYNVVSAPMFMPLPEIQRFKRDVKMIDEKIFAMIEQRKREGIESKQDLLSMLMEMRDEDTGEGMSEQQLRDELMTMIFAGHETTAISLMWIFYALTQHKEVAEKLNNEITSVLQGRTPTVSDTANMPYTKQVIQETMRLYPPVWIYGRKALEDDEIAGYYVKKGTYITLSPYAMHRNPDLWENPEHFNPERFSPERSKGRSPYAYFPFSNGQRKCIGDGFAMMEMQLLVPLMLQRFRMELVPNQQIVFNPLITLRSKFPMMMNLIKQ